MIKPRTTTDNWSYSMAEPNAQQLARQRLAATDLAKFAPPPKRKKAETEQPKYTTPA